MPISEKIKRFIGFHIPSFEISPEREEEIIENMATFISRFGMELPVLVWGYPFVHMSTILSQTTLLPTAPFLELFGIKGYDYVAFFHKKENARRLLKRIEELKDARERGQLASSP